MPSKEREAYVEAKLAEEASAQALAAARAELTAVQARIDAALTDYAAAHFVSTAAYEAFLAAAADSAEQDIAEHRKQ